MSEMLTPLSDSRHTKAEGKFTPQICRSRIFVPANECTLVVPMYPSQSAMSHLHSLAQSMYIATFLPKHVIPTCFADYVTSTSGAIRLAFDLSPWPQVVLDSPELFSNQEILTFNSECPVRRSSFMQPWVGELLRLLSFGSASSWFGLACPAHCSASSLYLACFLVTGFCLGFLAAALLVLWLHLHSGPPGSPPAAFGQRFDRVPTPSLRLSAYLHERSGRSPHLD